jgi:hypothetical protein
MVQPHPVLRGFKRHPVVASLASVIPARIGQMTSNAAMWTPDGAAQIEP